MTNHAVHGRTRAFTYDFTGRMTTLTDTNGSVFAYEFDGEGNRLSQSLNDCLSKRFVYDGADVLLELNPTNGVAYAWINGPGIDQPIERLLYIDGAPRARRVFHSDAIGSIAALTDPDGLLTQSYSYSAFGSLRSSSGHDPNHVTYTAREHLGDSQGWMYYRHRIYNPNLGRFTAADLLKFVDGEVLFAYAKNNPVYLSDSLGLWTKQAGLMANVGAGFGVNVSLGVAWSYSLQDGFDIGAYVGLGAGGHIGATAAAGLEYQMSANGSIANLAGTAMMYGLDVPAGPIPFLGVGADMQCPVDDNISSSYAASITFGPGADVHSYGTYTWVFSPKPLVHRILGGIQAIRALFE